ncbi:MAG: peptide synthase [Desulfuromonas sp.]|nr:MAG: peptide synthase [Desulfuromonas sp.]
MSETTLSNIAAHLPRMAQLRPHAQAVVFPTGRDAQRRVCYSHYTFAQLDAASDIIAAGLLASDIQPGERAVLMVTPSLEFFALTFALFKAGVVPVMIDPGMGVKNLKVCISEAEPQIFIGIPKAHIARILLGWGKKSLRTQITVGKRRGWGGITLDDLRRKGESAPAFRMAETDAESTAAILFTSGSTGVPKGVVYSHGNFARQVAALKEIYGITPGEIDLPTFPLFALFAPALGMTAIIPDMDFTRPAEVDPEKIAEAIENFGITNMFGSPALINRVGRWGVEQKRSFPSLRRVISAGAPVPAATLERFASLLAPEAEIFTPYGATESLPVCSIGHHEILGETRARTDAGHGVCVGRPVPELTIKIIPIRDEAIPFWSDDLSLPPDTIGEIAVRGAQVTRRYYNRADSTDLAKILDPANATFYHRMGDLGYRDEAGRIWFCGRKAHRVECDDKTLLTIPTEAIFNTHPEVFRSALVGVGTKGKQRPAICIELEKGIEKKEQNRIRTELLQIASQNGLNFAAGQILFHPAFPVDIRHNAKIFREKLARWAKGKVR